MAKDKTCLVNAQLERMGCGAEFNFFLKKKLKFIDEVGFIRDIKRLNKMDRFLDRVEAFPLSVGPSSERAELKKISANKSPPNIGVLNHPFYRGGVTPGIGCWVQTGGGAMEEGLWRRGYGGGAMEEGLWRRGYGGGAME